MDNPCMDRVRRVRNALLHFTGPLSFPEYDLLLRANTWLAQRPAWSPPDPAAAGQKAKQTGTSGNPHPPFMGRPLRTSVPEVRANLAQTPAANQSAGG